MSSGTERPIKWLVILAVLLAAAFLLAEVQYGDPAGAWHVDVGDQHITLNITPLECDYPCREFRGWDEHGNRWIGWQQQRRITMVQITDAAPCTWTLEWDWIEPRRFARAIVAEAGDHRTLAQRIAHLYVRRVVK